MTDGSTGSTPWPGPAHPGTVPRVPDGIRTIGAGSPSATRLVLIRHGEAVCNVSGVCGGPLGCRG